MLRNYIDITEIIGYDKKRWFIFTLRKYRYLNRPLYKSDLIDWKIISLLNKCGRMPKTDIGLKMVNHSARTFSNRNNMWPGRDLLLSHHHQPGSGCFERLTRRGSSRIAGVDVEGGWAGRRLTQFSFLSGTTGESGISVSFWARNIE